MKRIPFFKPGKHRAESGDVIEFTEADVQQIVETYDPKLHEAPLVIGHPKMDAPAYGLVQSVELAEGGITVAIPHKVHQDFADGVRDGRYSKRSASLYTPQHPNNPTPGKWYLRHIGFLGAHPPAVKGLPEVGFGETEEGVVSFAVGGDDDGTLQFGDYNDARLLRMLRGLKNLLLGNAGFAKDAVEEALPEWGFEAATESALQSDDTDSDFSEGEHTAMTPEQLAQREADIAKREQAVQAKEAQFAELETREQKLTEKEQAARTAEIASFCDGLIADGKLLPAHKDGMVAFMATLPLDAAVEFGEGDQAQKKQSLDFFQDFLQTLPKQVEFAELGKGDEVPTLRHDFGESVDEASLDVWNRAKAIQKSEGITFSEALVKARNQE